tara:strand:+ start:6010 stop:7866 length:1857 start_codon:yes stop_codon:yes gene_type:complete
MANKFVIEVRAKGFTNLEEQFNKANGAARGFDTTTGRLRGSTSGLRRNIGALRNNILLYTFAIGGAIKAVSMFVKTASKFEQVRTRLVGLTGSVLKANRAFETFNAVAATTPFSLEDVADAGAQLKAFGADANALIKPITDLAAFMGTTAVEAANSFGRAFAGGAGAADILREKGILNIIKSSQGLTDLANTSLPEFRKALIETLQDPVVGIAGSTDRMSQTFEGAFSNMNDSVSRLSAEIGDTMLPSLKEASKSIGSLADRVGDYIRSFTESEAEAMLRNLKAIGVETKALTALEVLVFKEQTVKRIEGMNKAIADILEKNPKLKDTFDRFGDFEQTVKKVEGFRDFSGEIRNVTITSEKAAELLEVLGQQMNLTKIDALGMAESIGTGNQATSEATQKTKDQFTALASLVAILAQQDLIYKQLADTIAELSVNQDEVTVKIVTFKSAMSELGKGGRFAVKAFDQLGDAFAQAALTATTFGEAGEKAINSLAATIISKAATFALLKTFFGAQTAGLGFGSFLLGSMGIKHDGGPVQKFAGGGTVRGQDNVPILAQAGEFIIKRDSAQSIGLDQLRQMNETGQSSNVNLHFSGPITNADYVRDVIAPEIQKAMGRNLA